MLENMRPQNYANTEVHGVVVNNADPGRARRLQIRVAVVHDNIPDDQLPWAVCGVPAGRGPLANAARVEIPAVGADLLVKFQQGDPQNPIYTGAVSSSPTVPALFHTNYPNRSGTLLPNGTYLYVDEITNDLMVHHQATTVLISGTGQVNIHVAADANIDVMGKTYLKTTELNVDCPLSKFTGIVEVFGVLKPHAGILGEGDAKMDLISLKAHKHPTAPAGPVSSAIP